MDNPRIVANLATFPEREGSLVLTISSIISQADIVNVYLNNYQEIPPFLAENPKINPILSSDAEGDLRDNGKFYFLQECESHSYYFTLDDDIIYPPNYVAEMVKTLRQYNNEVIVGVHGVIFDKDFKGFHSSRKNIHFESALDNDRVVSLLGTGTSVFYRGLLGNLSIRDFRKLGMADLYLSAYCKKHSVPLFCVKRRAGWLKGVKSLDENSSLWEESKKDENSQNAIILSNRLWEISPIATRFYIKYVQTAFKTGTVDELVSVIIPTTQERELSPTIASLREQSYQNIEVIIIPDSYKRGAPVSRNLGVERSSGSYLLFLDDDIVLKNDFIESLLQPLRDDDSLSFVYCNYRRTGTFNDVVRAEKFNRKTLLDHNYISTMSLIRKRDFIGWDESLYRFQDWDMWLGMAERGCQGLWVPRTLFTANYSGDGITDSGRMDLDLAKDIVLAKHGMVVSVLSEKYQMIYRQRADINVLLDEKKNLSSELEGIKLVINGSFWLRLFSIIFRLFKRRRPW